MIVVVKGQSEFGWKSIDQRDRILGMMKNIALQISMSLSEV